jgi:hypothetical protein
MQHPSRAHNTDLASLRRCPTCRGSVSTRLHVTRIAGDVILDCPTCWTTTVFDHTGRVVRRGPS